VLNKPLGFYTNESSLRFHLLGVDEGLMMLIVFPNNKVMLYDCNVTADNEDSIISYLKSVIPIVHNPNTNLNEQPIHVFANSHRDEDHYRGLKKVNAQFPIQSIWDSGQSGDSTASDDYQYYMGLRLRLKAKNENNLKVPTPSDIPIASFNGVEIYCFASEEHYSASFGNGQTVLKHAAKVQHTNSMVLQVKYGNIALLLTGDSDWKSWKEKIIPNFKSKVKSNILIASHHGSRSFFTDEANDHIDILKNPDTTYMESIDLISPDITLISCGKYDTYHHPNIEALKIYKKKSKNNQVYTTNSYGHLLGFIEQSGNYTVVPRRFQESRSASRPLDMQIICKYTLDGNTKEIANGSSQVIGGELSFEAKTFGGMREPIDKVQIWWEVSNGGTGTCKSHQEIYYKGDDEETGMFRFNRLLSYRGTHLLLCRIHNKAKGSITRIFRITGV